MNFEATYLESCCYFIVPLFAHYFNEQVVKIWSILHLNKAFPPALNSFVICNCVCVSVYVCVHACMRVSVCVHVRACGVLNKTSQE